MEKKAALNFCGKEESGRSTRMELVGAAIKIGVSSCVLGHKTRYDGGHKRDGYVADILARVFTPVGVCPELGAGMTVPREPLSLYGDPGSPRFITDHTGIDMTDTLLDFCRGTVEEPDVADLCGFVLKKNSPSCGLSGVPIHGESRGRSGSGLFAAALRRKFPHLPMEDEVRLADPVIRENFIERIFGYRRWKDFLGDNPDPGKLVEFHTRNKLVMMSHSIPLYRESGRLLANGSVLDFPALLQRYEELFMNALEIHATVRKHTKVLEHVMGYFRNGLTPSEKDEMLDVFDQYHQGLVPLTVPVTLLNHYVHRYDQQYLREQYYLFPHPAELMLRNHA